MDAKRLASYIDHTNLSATARRGDIAELCDSAIRLSFCSVCVNQRWVEFCSDRLCDSGVKVCTVIGFPLGADSRGAKVSAVKEAIRLGADEVDVVADLAAVQASDGGYLTKEFVEILKVCGAVRPGVVMKVIIEAAALSDEQKIFVCKVADICGVDFVKTSTGMHKAGGATVADVELMKKYASRCKVKAAGGIRTADAMLEFIEAGAERIGTSCGVSIVENYRAWQ